jgi:F-type H+-transporting ATPase subunit epsilon
MQLEIITPENKIFNGKADAVQMPGKDGLFQILDGHAPLISTLGKGMVKIDLPDSYKKFDELSGKIEPDKSNDRVLYLPIDGGVIEVQNDKVILLAD